MLCNRIITLVCYLNDKKKRRKFYFSCGIDKSRLFQNKGKKFQVQMEKPEKTDTLMKHLSIKLLVYYHTH